MAESPEQMIKRIDGSVKSLTEKYEEINKHLRFVGSVISILKEVMGTGSTEDIQAAGALRMEASERLEKIADLTVQMIDILKKK